MTEILTRKPVGTRYKKLQDILTNGQNVNRIYVVRFFDNFEVIYYHDTSGKNKPIGAKVTENDKTSYVRLNGNFSRTVLADYFDHNENNVYSKKDHVTVDNGDKKLHEIIFNSKTLKFKENNGRNAPYTLTDHEKNISVNFEVNNTTGKLEAVGNGHENSKDIERIKSLYEYFNL